MNLNFNIKDLNFADLQKIKFKCVNCSFWLDNNKNLFDDITGTPSITSLLKTKFIELKSNKNRDNFLTFFIKNGGRIKGAFSRKRCIGLLIAGKYYLFPKLKLFDIYPPDKDSIFLGCIYIVPEYRNIGAGKRLIIELEKDLIEEKINAIESVGKRMDDDIDIDEYINNPIIPVKFLIKNGFYIKKNNERFPLLRLELSSISMEEDPFSRKISLKNVAVENVIKDPAIFKKN